jgi:hypothetical protein
MYGSRKLPCGEGVSPYARLGRSARWTGAVAVSYVLVCCGRAEVDVAHQRRQTVGAIATARRVLSRPSIIPSVYIGMARMTSCGFGDFGACNRGEAVVKLEESIAVVFLNVNAGALQERFRRDTTTDGPRPEHRSHDNGGGRRVMVRSGPRWTGKQSVYKGHSPGADEAHRAYGDGRRIIR